MLKNFILKQFKDCNNELSFDELVSIIRRQNSDISNVSIYNIHKAIVSLTKHSKELITTKSGAYKLNNPDVVIVNDNNSYIVDDIVFNNISLKLSQLKTNKVMLTKNGITLIDDIIKDYEKIKSLII